jgi:hypothetical protein
MHNTDIALEKIQGVLRLAHARLDKSQADADDALECALKAEAEAARLRSIGELNRATGDSVIASQKRAQAQTLQQEATAASIQCEELHSQEKALQDQAATAQDRFKSASEHHQSVASIFGALLQVRDAAKKATDLHGALQAAKVALDDVLYEVSQHQQRASGLLEQAQVATLADNHEQAGMLQQTAADVAASIPTDVLNACKLDLKDAYSEYRSQIQVLEACQSNLSALKNIHDSLQGGRSIATQVDELQEQIADLQAELSKVTDQLEQQQAELDDAHNLARRAQELKGVPGAAEGVNAQEDADRWSQKAADCAEQIHSLTNALSSISSDMARSKSACEVLKKEQSNSQEVLALLKEIMRATQAGVDAIAAKTIAASKLQRVQKELRGAQPGAQNINGTAEEVIHENHCQAQNAENAFKKSETKLHMAKERLGGLQAALAHLLEVHICTAAVQASEQCQAEAEVAKKSASGMLHAARARTNELEVTAKKARQHLAAVRLMDVQQDVEAAQSAALQASKDAAAAAAEMSVAAEALHTTDSVLQVAQKEYALKQMELQHRREELQEAHRRVSVVALQMHLEEQKDIAAAELNEHSKMTTHITEAATQAMSNAHAAKDMEAKARKKLDDAQSVLQGLRKQRSSNEQVCAITGHQSCSLQVR